MDSAYQEKPYWDARYASGRTSGAGSRGEEAAWKIEQILKACKRYKIQSILDCGIGDGFIACQLAEKLGNPQYTGLDISEVAIQKLYPKAPACMALYVKDFTTDAIPPADLTICLDVLFHLSSQERHDAAIKAVCDSFKKVGIISAWSEKIVDLYNGEFCSHTVYRPFKVPAGVKIVAALQVPTFPEKLLYILKK